MKKIIKKKNKNKNKSKKNPEQYGGPVELIWETDMKTGNAAPCPAIEKIVFKTETETDVNCKPRIELSATVEFADGTKTSVLLTEKDGAKFERTHAVVSDPNSPVVDVPSFCSKRAAVEAAVLKRFLLAPSDGPGPGRDGDDFFEILDDEILVKEENVSLTEARDRYEKEKKGKAKLGEICSGFFDVVERMNDLVAQMAELAGSNPSVRTKP